MYFISVSFRIIWSWNRVCHANGILFLLAYLVTADLKLPMENDKLFFCRDHYNRAILHVQMGYDICHKTCYLT